ncbi:MULTISPECIES: hypothetical protein [Halomonadaceae]|uniref:hypothetical protein n=1 Tax=Halomonadaceae TaxID=28256 RepID=UPI001599B234|nr:MULTISPECIES: hypothetical protein [Halomonas]QJQ96652.1 hypothetical protein HIO72_16140 [Halomonas sp. PA5]
MAERPEEKRFSSPIVPDVDASLTAQHLRHHHRQAAVWPLWCLILLLMAGIGVMAYWIWEERLAMQQELSRLEGQLSNVHARLDGFSSVEEGDLDDLSDEMATLSSAQQAMRERLEEQEELLDSIRVASVDEQAVASLAGRVDSLGEELANLEAVVSSVRVSLDSLEQAGDDGRAALAARLGSLDEALSRQETHWEEVAALRERQQALEASLDERPRFSPETVQALEEELEQLASTIEALVSQRESDDEALTSMRGRLGSAQAELTEMRQSLLANSAQLEALQSQLGN